MEDFPFLADKPNSYSMPAGIGRAKGGKQVFRHAFVPSRLLALVLTVLLMVTGVVSAEGGTGESGGATAKAVWTCTTADGIRLDVKAEIRDGTLSLQMKASNLANNTSVGVNLDADGNGRADLTVLGNSRNTSTINASASTQTRVSDLSKATVRTNLKCTLEAK